MTTPPAPMPPGLTTLERVVLAACPDHPLPVKVLARHAQRSLNRVREAVSSLIAKGLLERMARWEVRRCPQHRAEPIAATDRTAVALALLKAAVQLLSQVDEERRNAA